MNTETLADWQRFLDQDAFASHASWSSYYGAEPHLPAPPKVAERPWRT